MNIIKLGGSILNPNGKYDQKIIDEFIALVEKSKERFIFVVGGGKICRQINELSSPLISNVLMNKEEVRLARDELGIAVTRINARYVLRRFKEKLGQEVYPEILLDPNKVIKSKSRLFFIGGWKPGCSTDKDMMLLAQTFQAKRIIKISNFAVVKKIDPYQLSKYSLEKREKMMAQAKDLPKMTWKELNRLVGTKWKPGLNTPFDPQAAKMGCKLRKKVMLYIVQKEELFNVLKGNYFKGTLVKG